MNADDDLSPDEDRNAVERHARRAQLEDGDHDLDSNRKRRDFGKGDELCPEVGALAGGEVRPGERNIGEPAAVRAGVARRTKANSMIPPKRYR